MKKIYLLVSFFSISLLAACDSENEIKPAEKEEQQEQQETTDSLWLQEEDIYNAPFKNQKKIALDENQQAISEKVNDFSWELFSKSFEKKKERNLLLSPLSLTQNLMMTCNGLRGKSLEEIKLAFGVSEFEMAELNQYVLQLNKGLAEADSRSKYRTDNSVWYRNDLTMQTDFIEKVNHWYRAEVFPAAMTEETLDSINDWAYHKTYGRIKDFLTNLAPNTQTVMVNTVYFRGQWFDKLTEKNIRDGIFRNENGEEESAKMVMYHGMYNYVENTKYQATFRLFGNMAYAMDFILPKEDAEPADALAQYMQDKERNRYYRHVELDFPRFKSGSKMDLYELLRSMGITNVFMPEDPSDIAMFDEPTSLGTVIQQTSITVNEKGAEAAAATANKWFWDNGEEITPPDTVYMKLERPFFYTIRETSTNTPLFIGYQGSVK